MPVKEKNRRGGRREGWSLRVGWPWVCCFQTTVRLWMKWGGIWEGEEKARFNFIYLTSPHHHSFSYLIPPHALLSPIFCFIPSAHFYFILVFNRNFLYVMQITSHPSPNWTRSSFYLSNLLFREMYFIILNMILFFQGQQIFFSFLYKCNL